MIALGFKKIVEEFSIYPPPPYRTASRPFDPPKALIWAVLLRGGNVFPSKMTMISKRVQKRIPPYLSSPESLIGGPCRGGVVIHVFHVLVHEIAVCSAKTWGWGRRRVKISVQILDKIPS